MVWLHALADPRGELHVRHHYRDALSMLRAQLRVNEEVDEVVLGGLLQGLDGETLETNVGLVVVLDQLTNELREREFTDEQIGRLLVLLDFPRRDCSLLGPSDLLDTLACPSGLTDSLPGDCLAWCLGC